MTKPGLKLILILSFLLPFIASSQDPSVINTQIIGRILNTLNRNIIPLLFILASAIFIWGVLKYIIKSDDEKARAQAKSLMLWGIVGLVVMLAVWGIVNILIAYFGVGGVDIPGPGTVPRQ